jgi:hypothetical protein
MKVLAFAVLAAAVLFPVSADAKNKAPNCRCVESCRSELKSKGLWTQYPRGYCKRRCGVELSACE